MKLVFAFLLLFVSSIKINGQQKQLPLNTFYKEKFIQFSKQKSIETFFPVNQRDLDLLKIIRDSSLQYSEATERIFKHHFIELSKKEGKIGISPIVHYTKGKNQLDTNTWPLSRNTRGVFIEGDLLPGFSFNFMFCENQGVFQEFESAYFNSRGELYPDYQGYKVQNAVIPGATRTKEFKKNGYDYTYSIGNISFTPLRRWHIDLGNGQHFIGSGYRSLLLSDNSANAPYLRSKWILSDQWEYQLMARKQLNLYRKINTLAVESNYESKLMMTSYLTYRPIPSVSLSLFTTGNQLRADSLIKHPFGWSTFVPLPLIQNDLILPQAHTVNGITGLNIDIAFPSIRAYGQFVLDRYDKEWIIASQLGAYFFNPFGVKNGLIQLEYNYVPRFFYADPNPKLSYSHFNLPSAHVKGNNFHELILKLSYEYDRLYLSTRTILYITKGGDFMQQLGVNTIFNSPTYKPATASGFTANEAVELGLRFNKKYNGSIFIEYRGRASDYGKQKKAYQSLSIGIKTALLNEYFDF